jgi:hypothetical protein
MSYFVGVSRVVPEKIVTDGLTVLSVGDGRGSGGGHGGLFTMGGTAAKAPAAANRMIELTAFLNFVNIVWANSYLKLNTLP